MTNMMHKEKRNRRILYWQDDGGKLKSLQRELSDQSNQVPFI